MCNCGLRTRVPAPSDMAYKTVDTKVPAPYIGMTQKDVDDYNFSDKIFEIQDDIRERWLMGAAIVGLILAAVCAALAMTGNYSG